jgi:hypothetical protein
MTNNEIMNDVAKRVVALLAHGMVVQSKRSHEYFCCVVVQFTCRLEDSTVKAFVFSP